MNNPELESLTAQLADIQLPQEPQLWPWYLGGALLFALILAAVQMVWRRRRVVADHNYRPSPREALRQLEQLQHEWQQQQIDDQRTAFRLATILRLGLHLPQLTLEAPSQLRAETSRWRQIIAQLQQLRYHRHPETKLDQSIFDHVHRWLSQENHRS